jgi:NADH:ubiquinone oxidoreductase subunit H
MLADAKQKELERLDNTMNSFPFDLTTLLLEQAVKRGKKHVFSSLGWLIGFSGLMFCAHTYATTILELFLLGGLGGFCFFKMIGHLILSFKELFAAQNLSDAIKKMLGKIEDLKKKANQ